MVWKVVKTSVKTDGRIAKKKRHRGAGRRVRPGGGVILFVVQENIVVIGIRSRGGRGLQAGWQAIYIKPTTGLVWLAGTQELLRLCRFLVVVS